MRDIDCGDSTFVWCSGDQQNDVYVRGLWRAAERDPQERRRTEERAAERSVQQQLG